MWLVVVLAGLGVAAWWGLWARVPEVILTAPTRGPIVETLAIIGRVAPPAEVRFVAREPTSITQTPVDEGDRVEAGQLLVHMDDAEALAMVAQAEAALAQAKAQTRQVRTVTSKTAEASLQEARAQLEEANRTAQRDESLFSDGMLTAAELDQSRTALEVARSRARAAELAAAATSRQGAQWQAAVAARTFAEAGLLVARRRAERLSVRAPAKGVVTERSVEVGDVVSLGSPLVTLVLDGPTELIIEPDEKNLAMLAIGQQARASAEAFDGQSFDATVDYIAPSVDAARGTIEVRLAVPEPPDYLRTDMTISVDIIVDENPDGLTVPSSAVMDLASPSPWVIVVEGERALRRPVQVGRRAADVVEITSGLTDSDRLVSQPSTEIEDDDRVRVVPP